MSINLRLLAIRNLVIALSVSALLITLSLLLAWTSVRSTEERRFVTESHILFERVEHDLAVGVASLDNLVTLFVSTPYTDESSFSIVSQRFMQRDSFLVASAYFQRTDGAKRQAFEAEMQRQGYAGFRVRDAIAGGLQPAQQRARHLALMYIEPLSVQHIQLLGLDLAADDQLQQTLLDVTDKRKTRGFFNPVGLASLERYWVFEALYSAASEESDKALNGVVAASLDLHAILQKLELPAGIKVSLRHGRQPEHIMDFRGTLQSGLGASLYIQHLIGGDVHPLLMRVEKNLQFSELPLSPFVIALISGLLISAMLLHLARSATARAQWLVTRYNDISRQIEIRSDHLASVEIQLDDALMQLREQEKKYRNLIQSTSEGYWMFDKQLRIIDMNNSVCNMLGYQRAELIGKRLSDLMNEDSQHVFARQTASIGKAIHLRYELNFQKKNGEILPVIMASTRLQDARGKVTGSFAFVTDISQRKLMEQELMLAASVFVHATEGIVITDAHANILNINEAFTQITGYTRDEAIGQNCRILQSGHNDRAFYQVMWQQLVENNNWEGEILNRRKDGEVYVEMLKISAIRDAQNNIQHYVGLLSDITLQRKKLNQLTHIAYYDTLTQLPNRLLLFDRLSQAMVYEQRRGLHIALVYLDLDGFKQVNDNFGHAIGDRLLIELSRRMHKLMREGDTIARFGGDEFVAMLIDLETPDAAIPIVERLIKTASEAVIIDGNDIMVSASIGYTCYPQNVNVGIDELLQQADRAMYTAKSLGKNRYHRFESMD